MMEYTQPKLTFRGFAAEYILTESATADSDSVKQVKEGIKDDTTVTYVVQWDE